MKSNDDLKKETDPKPVEELTKLSKAQSLNKVNKNVPKKPSPELDKLKKKYEKDSVSVLMWNLIKEQDQEKRKVLGEEFINRFDKMDAKQKLELLGRTDAMKELMSKTAKNSSHFIKNFANDLNEEDKKSLDERLQQRNARLESRKEFYVALSNADSLADLKNIHMETQTYKESDKQVLKVFGDKSKVDAALEKTVKEHGGKIELVAQYDDKGEVILAKNGKPKMARTVTGIENKEKLKEDFKKNLGEQPGIEKITTGTQQKDKSLPNFQIYKDPKKEDNEEEKVKDDRISIQMGNR